MRKASSTGNLRRMGVETKSMDHTAVSGRQTSLRRSGSNSAAAALKPGRKARHITYGVFNFLLMSNRRMCCSSQALALFSMVSRLKNLVTSPVRSYCRWSRAGPWEAAGKCAAALDSWPIWVTCCKPVCVEDGLRSNRLFWCPELLYTSSTWLSFMARAQKCRDYLILS